MRFRKLFPILMAMIFIVQLPLTVYAAVEANVAYGDVIIGATQVSYTPSQGADVVTEDHGGSVTVTGKSNEHTIAVNTTDNPTPSENGTPAEVPTGPVNVEVILDDVQIDARSNSIENGAAMSVTTGEGDTVTIELDGKNTLISGDEHAGLETYGEGNLVIQDERPSDTSTPDSLTAQGAGCPIEGAKSHAGGAGIGGAEGQDGKNITITGGMITAKAGASGGGAGIGGGGNGDNGGGSGINITITGGQIFAVGGWAGSGIGGGAGGDGENITISAGDVSASGGTFGAGIGGGAGGDGSNITISGGTVQATATGLAYGAGIGGGGGGDGTNIRISGGQVTATCSGSFSGFGFGAGIGGGYQGNGTNISISGGRVTCRSKAAGAGIGGGWYGDGRDISISGLAQVTAHGGQAANHIGGGKDGLTDPFNVKFLLPEGWYQLGLNGERIYGTYIPGNTSDGLSNHSYMMDYFWKEVEEKIREAENGDVIEVDAGSRTVMPSFIIAAVRECEVVLIIHWDGGEDITIDKNFSKPSDNDVYHLSDLVKASA